jgi:hypothetical protein
MTGADTTEIAAVVLRCQQEGCGQYTRVEVSAADVLSDGGGAAADLSPAFWARVRCAACGSNRWEGVLYRALPERRAYRDRWKPAIAAR